MFVCVLVCVCVRACVWESAKNVPHDAVLLCVHHVAHVHLHSAAVQVAVACTPPTPDGDGVLRPAACQCPHSVR